MSSWAGGCWKADTSSAQRSQRSRPWVPVAVHPLQGWDRPLRFSEWCFPQLTPRDLLVLTSSDFVTGHPGLSDEWGGASVSVLEQGVCPTVAHQGKMRLVGADLLPCKSLFPRLTFPFLCVVLSSLWPNTLLCLGLVHPPQLSCHWGRDPTLIT